jgi:hypothetical protein
MAREHAAFTPWAVVYICRDSLLDMTDKAVTVYVRAPNPAKADHAGRRVWAHFTKEILLPRGAEIPEWPRLDDRSDVLCLDDNDYAKLWKEAQTHKRWWAGHKENPIAFWFETDIKL